MKISKEDKKWIKVAIHKSNIDQINKLVVEGYFPNTQNAVNFIVKKYLENRERKVDVESLLSDYVYDMVENIMKKKKET